MKQITICGHHLLLTDAIKSFTTGKLQKLFNHNREIVRIRAELQSEYDHTNTLLFTAKALVEVGGPDFVASASSHNLYKSIDLLVAKLTRQVGKRHGVRRARRKDALAA